MVDSKKSQVAVGGIEKPISAASAPMTSIGRAGSTVGMEPVPIYNEAHIPSRLNPLSCVLPDLEIVHAIMDEAKLPQRPSAIIEGVLRKGGKMLLSGASKTWKSYLAIQLGVCVATGADWLGIPCDEGRVLYVNLEIDDVQFMQRVHDVANALEVDPTLVEDHFMIVQRPKNGLTAEQLVDAIVAKSEVQDCSLVIIDPLYKAFDGNENEQRDMAHFFSCIDRLAAKLECAVAVVHHQSKGFQGSKDVADRACGSSVLGRDPDAIVDVCRINGSGNAMRMSFVLRDYPEHDPIDYWFEHPLCVQDATGTLAGCRPINPHGSSLNTNRQAETLSRIEDACERLMQGRDKFDRKELVKELGMKGETINRYLKKSDRFTFKSHGNRCWVMRR